MIEYNEKDYPNLYNEILKDYHYRFPKFNPNPYPKLTTIRPNRQTQNDTN